MRLRPFPKLLDVLAIKGAIVTIDAMGCQLDIAKKIIEIEAGYILALKRNQGNLHDAIKHFFDSEIEDPESKFIIKGFKEMDYGHGRIETCKCYVCGDIEWLENKDKWEGLQSICMIESERHVNGEKSIERRYFISSLAAEPKLHLNAVRSHWKIENTLHWTLDMVFREDESRIMDRNFSENMAIIRHMAMNYIKNTQKSYKKPISIKGLSKLAGRNPDTLDQILNANF